MSKGAVEKKVSENAGEAVADQGYEFQSSPFTQGWVVEISRLVRVLVSK